MEQQMIANGGVQYISQIAVQYVYLDFDGALTSYNGEILTVDNVEIQDSFLTEERIENILSELNSKYSSQNVIFVSQRPKNIQYSTIYIGKTGAFNEYGNFAGLAETIDHGNENKSDNAFVLLDSTATDYEIISTISHETDHLLGTLDHGGSGLAAYFANNIIVLEKEQVTISASDQIDSITVRPGGTLDIILQASNYVSAIGGPVYKFSGDFISSCTSSSQKLKSACISSTIISGGVMNVNAIAAGKMIYGIYGSNNSYVPISPTINLTGSAHAIIDLQDVTILDGGRLNLMASAYEYLSAYAWIGYGDAYNSVQAAINVSDITVSSGGILSVKEHESSYTDKPGTWNGDYTNYYGSNTAEVAIENINIAGGKVIFQTENTNITSLSITSDGSIEFLTPTGSSSWGFAHTGSKVATLAWNQGYISEVNNLNLSGTLTVSHAIVSDTVIEENASLTQSGGSVTQMMIASGAVYNGQNIADVNTVNVSGSAIYSGDSLFNMRNAALYSGGTLDIILQASNYVSAIGGPVYKFSGDFISSCTSSSQKLKSACISSTIISGGVMNVNAIAAGKMIYGIYGSNNSYVPISPTINLTGSAHAIIDLQDVTILDGGRLNLMASAYEYLSAYAWIGYGDAYNSVQAAINVSDITVSSGGILSVKEHESSYTDKPGTWNGDYTNYYGSNTAEVAIENIALNAGSLEVLDAEYYKTLLKDIKINSGGTVVIRLAENNETAFQSFTHLGSETGLLSLQNQYITAVSGLTFSGLLYLNGTAENITVNEGVMHVLSSASVRDAIAKHGTLHLHDQANLSNAQIKSSGGLYASAGSFASEVIIESGGILQTFTGANISGSNYIGEFSIQDNIAQALVLENNGWLEVAVNGVASSTTIDSMGKMNVFGKAYDTVVRGGEEIVYGQTFFTTVLAAGSQSVVSGGNVSEAKINGGIQQIVSGTAEKSHLLTGQIIVNLDGCLNTTTAQGGKILTEGSLSDISMVGTASLIQMKGDIQNITISENASATLAGTVKDLVVQTQGSVEIAGKLQALCFLPEHLTLSVPALLKILW